MRKIAKILGILILSIIILLGIFLLISTIWNPKYEPVEVIQAENDLASPIKLENDFTITTFNIGYAGLDKYQDFFFDGGTMGRSKSYEKTKENLEGIHKFIKEEDSDFLFFQEVDRNSLRTYKIDEYSFLKEKMSDYGSVFAKNYTSLWVPVPIMKPMGNVLGGMATFSKYQIESARRYALEGQESWPMKLFELDRCFIETVHPVENGKKLILINVHLSAYDEGGILRNSQSAHLMRYITEQYVNGNYIVLGGDWNQLISNKQMEDPKFVETWPAWLVEIQADFESLGFSWGVGEDMTVRDLDAPYKPGITFETIIDGFLVSPNLQILEVEGHDIGFENSDHNPVTIHLKFN